MRFLALVIGLLPFTLSAEEKAAESFERQTSALLRLHEGDEKTHPKVRWPYRDSKGILTVGVGHNLEANGIPNGIGIAQKDLKTGLTDRQIEALLQHDVQLALEDLRKEFPWFENLSNTRKLVLLDMRFNLGIKGLKEFKKTLRHIENGRYEQASKEMLRSSWATQVGKRAHRLSEMMRTNSWPKEVTL